MVCMTLDGGGAKDDWDSSGEWTGVIQNENDLLLVVVGHPFYLDPCQGEAQRLRPSTTQPY